MEDIKILAIESSCDETACAIVRNGNEIISSVVSSQIDVHTKFGGVIPEVASRLHVENITLVINECLTKANMTVADIDAIAFTQGPGLIGSLHVGVQAAKTLAWMYDKPLIPIHHLAGHIYANSFIEPLQFPLLALIVSGGHTELVYMKEDYNFKILGSTQDDAIGEAYDKVARLLNLGYPGGPKIDKLAKDGKPQYKLPVPKTEQPLDFSFSGLKSAVMQAVEREKKAGRTIIDADLAASFQETALGMLIKKSELALNEYPVKQFIIAGGVAANSRLRTLVSQMCETRNLNCIIPPLWCCTDNAAMIGAAAYIAYKKQLFTNLEIGAVSSKELQ